MTELFKIESNKIENGDYLFSAVELNSCALKNWQSPLHYLTSAKNMFSHCDNLENFYGDLSSLSNGSGMFNNCSKLSQFSVGDGSLSNLEDGTSMFCNCTSLSTFNYDMSYLNVANDMFRGCKSLKTFYGYLSNLSDGSYMFYDCSSLESFGYGLWGLDEGEDMFRGCCLNSESVYNIFSSLPSYKGNYLHLTMNASGCQTAVELLGLTSGTIPYHEGNKGLEVNYHYWNISLTASDVSGFTISSGNSGDTVTLKYKGCTTVDEVKAVDPDYKTNDIIDGAWTEGLGDLEDGSGMFYDCLALETFESDLSSLTNCGDMFRGCSNLASFSSDLSSLTDSSDMFSWCENLTSFSSDLSSLTNSNKMFYGCSALTSFNADLSSLTNGEAMFFCTKLTSFSSGLSSLTDGGSMFNGCSNLTSFNADLSSLTDGYGMFSRCKLDTASVQNIADTINTPTSKGTINIGIGNTTPNEQEETAFNTIASKNWTVYVNGSSNSNIWTPTATTPIDGEQTTTPIPFWAKPVQSDEQHAHYVDTNGNFYNVLGGNYIYGDDLSTYGMFVSEEDAAANMRLTRIGEEEIETV